MANSIVLELQRDALDRSVPVSDLLRKALVVARKLGLSEFEEWVRDELAGYPNKTDVPDYRVVPGQVRAWNPYRGWIPVILPNKAIARALSSRGCKQSVAELEDQLQRAKDGGLLGMPFPAELAAKITEGHFPTEVVLEVQRSALAGILDAVRNTVLNWALKLEQDGIMGNGLSFSPKEKERASHVPRNINNFYGAVGTAQIAQNSKHVVQVSGDPNPAAVAKYVAAVRAALPKVDLKKTGRDELQAELTTVEAQLKSPKPKWRIIKEGLASIRTVLEGATGTIAAELVKAGLGL